jgi:hypothetical protein
MNWGFNSSPWGVDWMDTGGPAFCRVGIVADCLLARFEAWVCETEFSGYCARALNAVVLNAAS